MKIEMYFAKNMSLFDRAFQYFQFKYQYKIEWDDSKVRAAYNSHNEKRAPEIEEEIIKMMSSRTAEIKKNTQNRIEKKIANKVKYFKSVSELAQVSLVNNVARVLKAKGKSYEVPAEINAETYEELVRLSLK